MVSGKITIKNPKGLHLKPAGHLCNLAIEYNAIISLSVREKTVNAKSILGVLSACVKYGDEVEIICEGEDEEEALAGILQAITEGLGEEITLQD